jgi:hypothetical protein
MHQTACLIRYGLSNTWMGMSQIADCDPGHKIRIRTTIRIVQRAPIAFGQ